MKNERILELAKKLLELSKRGIGGEKENATNMLEKIMRDNNITWEDLEQEIKKERAIKYFSNDEKKFLQQVISSVVGRTNMYEQYSNGKKNYKVDVYLTDIEFIEVIQKHKFFWKEYQEQLELFYSAFIQKQKLYVKPDDKDVDDDKEMSDEEKEKLWKIMQMMPGIEKKSIVKQIGEHISED